MSIKRPMLAAAIKDEAKLQFPFIVSPKIDGIRCLKLGGKVVSRALKPIPNHYIRTTLEQVLPDGADGEIMVGDTFQACTSGVMSREGEPDFTFWMFDLVEGDNLEEPYDDRLRRMAAWEKANQTPFVCVVPTETIYGMDGLAEYEERCLADGFEGVMLRKPDSPYKNGRSTEKQGWLLKLKRFVDSEAQVLGFEEQMHNANAATTNALGLTERSSAKDGKVPAGTLGKFLVRDLESGIEFAIGTGEGLTQELRQRIWDDQGAYMGKVVKYKYQPIGVKEAPRLPIFLGFRDAADM